MLVEKITSALANMTSFYLSPLKHTADALDRTNAYANEYKPSSSRASVGERGLVTLRRRPAALDR